MRVSALALPLALLASLAGCGSEAPQTEAGALRFDVAPEGEVVRGSNTFVLELHDRASGAAVDDATVVAVPNMPAMGHGSSTDPKVEPAGGGRYRITEVVFTMPGTWELRVEATRGATSEHATFRWDVR